MNVTLESTDRIVELADPDTGMIVPARVWEGHTDSGIPCAALVTRIAVHHDADLSAFNAELQSCRPPTGAGRGGEAWPDRLVL